MATLSVLQTQPYYKTNSLTKYDIMIFINTIKLGKGIGRNIKKYIGMIGVFNHVATSGRGRL